MWGPYDPRPGAYSPDDPGGGDYNPASGVRLWYHTPATAPKPVTDARVTWGAIFDHWHALELDLHDRFRVDVEDTPLLKARTWRWLHLRITDLVSDPSSRTGMALAAAQQ